MTDETEKIILDDFEPATNIYSPVPRRAPTDEDDEASHLFEVMLVTPLPVPTPGPFGDDLDVTIEE